MKIYTYMCRNKDGTLKRGQVEATDRADAFRQLKGQGHLPLSLSEGASAPGPQGKPRLAMVAVAAALALTAGVVLFLAARQPKNASAPPETAPSSQQSLKSNAGKKPGAATDNAQAPETGEEDPSAATSSGGPNVQPPSVTATPGDGIATGEETQAEEEKPKPAFNTMSEQLVAMLGQPGEERPPLPDLSYMNLEDDFLRASANVLVITDKDSDALAAAKENVAWVKTYIAEAKKMGWTPAEYIRELENVRKQQAIDRREAILLMTEIEQELPDMAGTVREELNRELEEKGIIPLDPPPAEQ